MVCADRLSRYSPFALHDPASDQRCGERGEGSCYCLVDLAYPLLHVSLSGRTHLKKTLSSRRLQPSIEPSNEMACGPPMTPAPSMVPASTATHDQIGACHHHNQGFQTRHL